MGSKEKALQVSICSNQSKKDWRNGNQNIGHLVWAAPEAALALAGDGGVELTPVGCSPG